MQDSGQSAPKLNDPAQNAARESLSLDRRAMMAVSGAAVVGVITYPLIKRYFQGKEAVFIARNQRYDGPLEQTIADGLAATGFTPKQFIGKRVLLKPNLVEPTRASPQMTTHPAVVCATAHLLQKFGATVTVGEGPGHMRDTAFALDESGMKAALQDAKVKYVDLNHDDVVLAPNRGGKSPLKEFYLPKTVVESDLVISMPKLKTHHWMGITVSMKNLYGVFPGIVYGWPKNVLHIAGIPETVYDINASLPQTLAIVDAIECMEGDGPILGSSKHLGAIVVGGNLPAVDATCARIMRVLPSAVRYLSLAQGRLGPLNDRQIEQRGEAWQSIATEFSMLDVPHLQEMRDLTHVT